MYIPTISQAPNEKRTVCLTHTISSPSGIKTKEFKSRIYRNINVTDVKLVYSANRKNMYSENTFNIFLTQLVLYLASRNERYRIFWHFFSLLSWKPESSTYPFIPGSVTNVRQFSFSFLLRHILVQVYVHVRVRKEGLKWGFALN